MRNNWRAICWGLAASMLLAHSSNAQSPPPPSDLEAAQRLKADFVSFDPNYVAERKERVAEVRQLAADVFARERAGKPTQCSHQILFELESLLISTADFRHMDERIGELRGNLAHPEREARAEKPDTRTGLWGACYDAWFLKLYDTYDRLEKATPDEPAPHPFPRFLAPVATPELLTARLRELSVSDVRRTGVDREREYNDTLATLLQMIVRGRPENYTVDPTLRRSMLALVTGELRNPETGWWGERYVRDGRLEFVDDLSITFHVVSYLKRDAPDMPRVIDTLLAVKDMDYPVGWLWQGSLWNHNNMDIVTIFRLGWPTAGPEQRAAIAQQIQRMIDWSVTQSLQPDGSFKAILPDGSIEDAETYGAEFLLRAGYFDKSQRFWTTRDFPDAPGVKARIVAWLQAHVQSGGAGGDSAQGVLRELQAAP